MSTIYQQKEVYVHVFMMFNAKRQDFMCTFPTVQLQDTIHHIMYIQVPDSIPIKFFLGQRMQKSVKSHSKMLLIIVDVVYVHFKEVNHIVISGDYLPNNYR